MLNSIYNFVIKFQDRKWFQILSLLTITCLVMIPLPWLGIPMGADLTQHLQFASTYHDSILSGDFFPGWAASDNQGFGSIGIRFYPPFAYYLLAVSQILTQDWFTSLWTNAFLWMFVGCLGMYLWAREWLSPIESIFAALFYAFTPYHRFQIYQIMLFAEFAAMGVLPFCFLTVTKVIRRGKTVDVIWFGVTIAILILTHIPTTVLGFIGLGLYALFLLERKNYVKTLTKLSIGFSLGLAASSFHWLRLVSELNLVKHTAPNYAVDFYDYKQHFYPLATNLKSFLPPLDFAIILIFLSLLPLFVYFFRKTKPLETAEKKLATALAVSGSFCLFMMSAHSGLIWEKVSFLQKVQFPWRWLSVASVIASLAFVFAFSKFIGSFQTKKQPILLIITAAFSLIFIYNFVQTITPSAPLNRENFNREITGLKEKKGCECWQPNWATANAFSRPEKISAESRSIEINRWDSEVREFKIGAGTNPKIRVATFYYPHWKAEVNGNSVELENDPDGSILIPVSETESLIKLNFREPLMLQSALAVSVLTWLFLITTLFLIYGKSKKL